MSVEGVEIECRFVEEVVVLTIFYVFVMVRSMVVQMSHAIALIVLAYCVLAICTITFHYKVALPAGDVRLLAHLWLPMEVPVIIPFII